MSQQYQRECAKCHMAFQSDKDWPVQTCPSCWKAGYSVTKTGQLYQRRDKAAAIFEQQPAAQPVVVAPPQPAPAQQANDVAGLMLVQAAIERMVTTLHADLEACKAGLALIRDELVLIKMATGGSQQ